MNPKRSGGRRPTDEPMRGKQKALDAVLLALDRHCQRATYAAVGGIVGLPAQSVMQGRERAAMHSWVVSKSSHLPTGYSVEECHPKLTSNPTVLQTPDALRAWLNGHA